MVHELTNREKQITHLTAQGFIDKEIADKLFISSHTVHTYKKRIRTKLNAKNIADITRIYILSLPKPKDVLKAVLFLVIQLNIIFSGSDIDLRLQRPTRVQQARIARIKTK